MTKPFQVEFSISAGACICSCFLLLLLPLNIVISIYSAMAIHELCHLGSLFILQIPVFRIEIGVGGAIIHTAPLTPVQELLCAAAGPLGSFLCLMFLRSLPVLALCGFVQGLYNLLPIYPLDGGRMIRCMCQLFFPKYTHKVCLISKFLAIIAVITCCAYLFFLMNDLFYVAAAFYFVLQTLRTEKSLAKSSNIEYNKADF